MPKLAVFDVDGVLLDTDIGGFKELARLIGKDAEVRKHDEEYQRRKHLGPWGLEELAQMFAGTNEKILLSHAKTLIQKHLRSEAYDVIAQLKKEGYLVVAYSSNPMWVMNALKEMLNLDDVCGNEVEAVNGVITGKLLVKMDRYGKRERLERFQQERGISAKDTYIFGDSVTDLPMAELGNFYAFNAEKQEVIDKAIASIRPPLSNVLKYL